MTFAGSEQERSKIVIDNIAIEQVNQFNILGFRLSYLGKIDYSIN